MTRRELVARMRLPDSARRQRKGPLPDAAVWWQQIEALAADSPSPSRSEDAMTDIARHDPRFLSAGVYVAHDGTRLWLREGNPNWLEQTAEVCLESETLLQLFTYATQHNLIRRPQ